MGPDDPPGRSRVPIAATALAWSLALVPAALWAPVYHGESTTSAGAAAHTSATLVQANGAWVLIPVAVPALLALVVLASFALRSRLIATIAVTLLAGFNLIAMFSIGLFILPATALLVWAVFAATARAPGQPAPA